MNAEHFPIENIKIDEYAHVCLETRGLSTSRWIGYFSYEIVDDKLFVGFERLDILDAI